MESAPGRNGTSASNPRRLLVKRRTDDRACTRAPGGRSSERLVNLKIALVIIRSRALPHTRARQKKPRFVTLSRVRRRRDRYRWPATLTTATSNKRQSTD